MSHHDTESAYTPQEIEENSRIDALAIFSIVVIVVGIVVYYVAG
jgi:hypothetical protein